MSCKFEIRIETVTRFHCAVIHGPHGWAYTYSHRDTASDPCPGCPFKRLGLAASVRHELSSDEYMRQAGGMINARDWKCIKAIKGKRNAKS